MKNLILPMGLGDIIFDSAAVIWLRNKFGDVRVFCMHNYLDSVRSFFDGEEGIVVQAIGTETELLEWPGEQIIAPSYLTHPWYKAHGIIHKTPTQFPGEGFDEWQYRHLGVPFDVRWALCPIPKAVERINLPEVKNEAPYIFVHDDATRGQNIDLTRITSFRSGDMFMGRICKAVAGMTHGSILQWVPWMRGALEFHTTDSSLMHLRNCFDWPQKCFLHAYARDPKPAYGMFKFLGDWTILR